MNKHFDKIKKKKQTLAYCKQCPILGTKFIKIILSYIKSANSRHWIEGIIKS